MKETRTEARQRDIERFILEQFDLPGLKRIGFIKSSKRSRENFLAIEKRVVTFFGFSNIYEYTRNPCQEFSVMKADPEFFKEN